MSKGDVRRAKLYYMRDRHGKAARIREQLAKGIGELGDHVFVADALDLAESTTLAKFLDRPLKV